MKITFSIVVPDDIHERARRAAFDLKKSLREWGGEAIEQRLERENPLPARRFKKPKP